MIYNTWWFGCPSLTAESLLRLASAEHVVDSRLIGRRRTEAVSAQTRFGELDDVLVAVRDGEIDELVVVIVARIDVRSHGRTTAKAGIKRAA